MRIRVVLLAALSSGIALLSSLVGTLLGVTVARSTRGRNLSDLGVTLWEHAELACVLGLSVFLTCVATSYWLMRAAEAALPHKLQAALLALRLVGAVLAVLVVGLNCL